MGKTSHPTKMPTRNQSIFILSLIDAYNDIAARFESKVGGEKQKSDDYEPDEEIPDRAAAR